MNPSAPVSGSAVKRSVACLALLAAFGLTLTGRAGEKIRITDSPEKESLPKNINPVVPSDSFRRTITPGDGGANTVFPTPPPQVVVPNRKLEELWDKKKNWIYDSPNSMDRDRAFEEAFGVRKYELDDLGKKPKSREEQYFDSTRDTSKDERSRKTTPLGSSSSLDRKDTRSGNSLSGKDDELDKRGIIEEFDPARLFNWTSPSDAMTAGNGWLNGRPLFPSGFGQPGIGDRPLGNQPVRPANSNPALGDLNKVWDVQRGPLGRFADPINDPGDATRSPMMPITARKASTAPSESSQRQIGEMFPTAASSPFASRPDFFDSGGFRGGGLPSVVPSAPAPALPRPLPKPAVLEIPRPKF